MIMGDTCTRACAFCNVRTGLPGALDADEPEHVGGRDREARSQAHRYHIGRSRRSCRRRGAAFCGRHPRHPRALPADDDRGADAGFPAQGRRAAEMSSRRGPTCSTTISKPCRRNISRCGRARATSTRLRLLQQVKELDPSMFTKSGIMVGLGEERNEVLQVMDDLRAATSISSPSANICSRRASITRSCASSRRTNSRPMRPSPMPRDF